MSGSDLISHLSEGWQADQPGLVQELIRVWWRKTQSPTDDIVIEDDLAFFSQTLDSIKLRNFNNVHVLIAGGTNVDRKRLYEWQQSQSIATAQFIVLALSETAFVDADSLLPAEREYLVVEPEAVREMFEAQDATQPLKAYARRRLSRYRLNPFGILRVPGSNMLAGRQHELALLQHSDSTSFAVAGPGRIGKTSLVQHFRRMVRRTDRSRYARIVYVDYLPCPDVKDEKVICSYLTFKINATKWGHDRTPDKLEAFLRTESKSHGGQLELILDEVDLVCNSKTFNLLAEAAKNGACRLILCGKFRLYEAMHSRKHVFCGRLRMLPLTPLTESETRGLFIAPLRDLGFAISSEEHLVSSVYSDTGGFPHLIQFYGDALVGAAMHNGQEEINPKLLEGVLDTDETDQFLASQLLGLEDPIEQLIGLVVVHDQPGIITENTIKQLAAKEGITLDVEEAERLCRRLYINNVLSRQGEFYQIANRGLSRAVRRRGYLARRLYDLRKEHSRKR